MRLRVLGCSGGIGAGLKTTSTLIDDDLLIDAGTGVGDLSLDQLARIRHVFLTHSHIDHIASLPLMLDSVYDQLVENPLMVHARHETIDALRKHLFNDVLWPDFTRIPTPENPVIQFSPLEPGESVQVGDRTLLSVDVKHSVPAVGYVLQTTDRTVGFSGDTTTNKTLWPVLNACQRVDVLVIEVSFPNSLEELATAVGHYCPKTLAEDLERLEHQPDIWLTAMKPGEEHRIYKELFDAVPDRRVRWLTSGDYFEL
ncbi:MAG: 3',5'-cyclic-nucleotide phosphodiesterase [Pseudomonadota bacterium]